MKGNRMVRVAALLLLIAASGGVAAQAALSAMVGDWSSLEPHQPGQYSGTSYSLRLAIQADGNVKLRAITKVAGQQTIATSNGRIEGGRLLLDNGSSGDIRSDGSVIEFSDPGQQGRVVRLRRR